MTQTQALIPLAAASDYRLFDPDSGDVAGALTENFGEDGLRVTDLDRVKVPAGGGTSWTVPTLKGEVDQKVIEGVIVALRSQRAYWRDEYAGQNSPPDCFSRDGQEGIGDPGGPCLTCPLSQFGDNGERPPCKARQVVFIVPPGSLLPLIVNAPPTSIKRLRKYLVQLSAEGLPYYGVITRLGLEKAKNAGGIVYSEIVPEMIEQLVGDQLTMARSFSRQLAHLIESSSGASVAAAIDDAPATHHRMVTPDDLLREES